MSKLPPFTLVYRPGETAQRAVRKPPIRLPGLSHYMGGGDAFGLKGEEAPAGARTESAPASPPAAEGSREISEAPSSRLERVGLWDLSAQVGDLPRVTEGFNEAQDVFEFYEVQAAVPSGLISRPDRIAAWAASKLAAPLTPEQVQEIRNNLIFEDFAERARTVRRDLGLDQLIGIVPAMVAFEEEGSVYWNFFSMAESRLMLVSTFEVGGYARQAGRPFEVAVAVLALSSLLASLNPKVEFHEETRGCLFDFNRDRASFVESIRRLEIEPDCLRKIDSGYREAARALVAALRKMGTSEGPQRPDPDPHPGTKKRSSSASSRSSSRTRTARGTS